VEEDALEEESGLSMSKGKEKQVRGAIGAGGLSQPVVNVVF
jgi:hypothetical protein